MSDQRAVYDVAAFLARTGDADDNDADADAATRLLRSRSGLVPSLLTSYCRAYFQMAGDDSLRVTLDVVLRLAAVRWGHNDDAWFVEEESVAAAAAFPFAVLEVKRVGGDAATTLEATPLLGLHAARERIEVFLFSHPWGNVRRSVPA